MNMSYLRRNALAINTIAVCIIALFALTDYLKKPVEKTRHSISVLNNDGEYETDNDFEAYQAFNEDMTNNREPRMYRKTYKGNKVVNVVAYRPEVQTISYHVYSYNTDFSTNSYTEAVNEYNIQGRKGLSFDINYWYDDVEPIVSHISSRNIPHHW